MNIVVETEDERFEITLEVSKSDMKKKDVKLSWHAADSAIMLAVLEMRNDEIEVIKDKKIITDDDDIKAQFAEQRFELEKEKLESTASGIEPTTDNETIVSKQEIRPYNPDLIRVDTKQFTVHQISKLIHDGDIDFSPDFQRHFVWKEIEKKSRLIESIMLRIPLPVFYFAQDDQGKFQIVDGLQRLTVIRDFLNNQFKLKQLEYLKESEERYFTLKEKKDPIEQKYLRRIEQATLTINIIDAQTPTSVKLEIFKRINQGGKPLKAQEIRNCMSASKTRVLMQKLSSSAEFKEATDYSINGLRMEDQEIVLRFCAFYYLRIKQVKDFKYSGNMELFLDETLEMLNKEENNTLLEIETLFFNSMKNAYHLFGKYSFRKCLREHFLPNARRQFINKSLFTTYSILLSSFDNSKIIVNFESGYLNDKLADEISSNNKYLDSITNGTNDLTRLNYSFETAEKLINQNLRL